MSLTAAAVFLLVGALAGCQITETIHHGSIFGGLRATARAWRKSPNWILSKAGELIECPFCLSHWACGMAVTWLWLTPTGSPWQVPVFIFAAVRMAQILNDYTHSFTRSPPSDETEETVYIEQSVDLVDFDE